VAAAPVDLRTFRRLAKLLTFASLLATVAGLYAALQRQWGLAALGIGAGLLALYAVQRLAIQPAAGSENVLLVVTKDECSLCDEARLLLPTLIEGTPFRTEEVKIESDRFLRRHFKDHVPVLLWQGEELARLRWDPATVRARLDAILAERRPVAGRQSP
jgi:glutaredoxin-like protein DUF836